MKYATPHICFSAILCLVAISCGDNDDSVDAGGAVNAASSAPDAAAGLDAPAPDGEIDGGEALVVPDATVPDATVPDATVPDATVPDAPLPDAPVPEVDLGPVSCRTDDECPAAMSCNRLIPGGVCTGCGGGSCPDDAICYYGSCVRECIDGTDCSLGMRCTSVGRCAQRRCDEDPDCPGPYVCAEGYCRRPECVGGAPCPAPLTCVDEVCVEP